MMSLEAEIERLATAELERANLKIFRCLKAITRVTR